MTGLGVPHTPPPGTSFQVPQVLPVPLLYPGDKPDPGLIQLITQNRLTMQPPHSGHEGMDGDMLNQEKTTSHSHFGTQQPKQFENMPHPYNDNYFSEFGANQCMNPPGQYGNMLNPLNPYGNQSANSNLSRHSSAMTTLHQMTAGGLVQSSNELASRSSPANPPIPPSQSTNPSLHCISPSGKQNNYLHSSQTGIVSPQSSAHRTQRVS